MSSPLYAQRRTHMLKMGKQKVGKHCVLDEEVEIPLRFLFHV
jgi:hypothetical protein